MFSLDHWLLTSDTEGDPDLLHVPGQGRLSGGGARFWLLSRPALQSPGLRAAASAGLPALGRVLHRVRILSLQGAFHLL